MLPWPLEDLLFLGSPSNRKALACHCDLEDLDHPTEGDGIIST